MACASPTACFAVARDRLFASTDPTGGPSAWTPVDLPVAEDAGGAGSPPAVSCPLADTCMLDGRDLPPPSGGIDYPPTDLAVTAAPATGITPVWTQVSIRTISDRLVALSCPSAQLCVGADQTGRVFTSTNPAGSRPSWTGQVIVPRGGIAHLTCASARLCLMSTQDGDVWSTTAPASGKWKKQHVDPGDYQGDPGSIDTFACAGTVLCWAADTENGDGGDYGGLWWRSTDPGADTWTSTEDWDIGSTHQEDINMVLGHAVACASTRLCVVTGTDTVHNTPATAVWQPGHQPVIVGRWGDGQVSCTTSGLCAVSRGRTVHVSASPARTGSWHPIAIRSLSGARLEDISCPSSGLCVSTTSADSVVVSTRPTGGAGSWRVDRIATGALVDLNCPTTRDCFAVAGGRLVVGRR